MKLVSFVGDSISTFEGYNPYGYAVYYTVPMQIENGLNSVEDTWWALVLKKMNAELCVNNSYSGSLVSGSYFPAGVSDNRLQYLHNENAPDLILIYMGINDYAHGVTALNNSSSASKDTVYCFEDAYDTMLEKIRKNYLEATVICATLPRPFVKDHEDLSFPEIYKGVALEDYDLAIRKTARKHGCLLADISSFNERYETLDGVHPTMNGHKTFAELWIRCLTDFGLSE